MLNCLGMIKSCTCNHSHYIYLCLSRIIFFHCFGKIINSEPLHSESNSAHSLQKLRNLCSIISSLEQLTLVIEQISNSNFQLIYSIYWEIRVNSQYFYQFDCSLSLWHHNLSQLMMCFPFDYSSLLIAFCYFSSEVF